MKPTCLFFVALIPLLLPALQSRAEDKHDSSKWESTIVYFETLDKEKPPPKNPVLFVGSPIIHFWDLEKYFPKMDVLNRGFGGSHIADSVHFADRLIIKYDPKILIFYAGDNDIAAGKLPKRVFDDFQELTKAVHKKLQKLRIVFIAIKPSPARWKLWDKQKEANALIEKFCKKDDRLIYLDVSKSMLGKDGKPKESLFQLYGLHLNDEGYKIWASLLEPLLSQNK
jgi:lysophospholipase L1-like esterase